MCVCVCVCLRIFLRCLNFQCGYDLVKPEFQSGNKALNITSPVATVLWI